MKQATIFHLSEKKSQKVIRATILFSNTFLMILFSRPVRAAVTNDNDISTIFGQESSLVQKNNITNLSVSLDNIVISGVFGTCNWDIDEDGQLTIHEGTLGVGKPNWQSSEKSIKSVVVESGVKANADSSRLFSNLSVATKVDIANLDTSEVVNMESMFDTSPKIETLDVSNFDISKVKSIASIFNSCKANVVGLSNWNTENVTNMAKSFSSTNLVNNDEIKYWNTSNVTNMSEMFEFNGSTLTNLDLSHWDKSNVKDISKMFTYDYVLTDIEGLDTWDTSNVTNMAGLFSNTRFTELPAVENWDVSNVTDMSAMFSANTRLASLDLSKWKTPKLQDISFLIQNDTNLNETNVKGLNDLDTSQVTKMQGTFQGTRFTELDLSNWNTSKVQNFQTMFSSCSKLTKIIGDFDTRSATNMSSMFSYTNQMSDLSDGLNISEWDTSKVTDFYQMFSVSGINNADFTKNWNTGSATNFSLMFNNDSKITSIDTTNWDTSSATDMSSMFSYTQSLKKVDVSNWDTSNVKNFEKLFSGANNLTKLNLSNWDTRNGANKMTNFLSGVNKLWQISLGPNTVLAEDVQLLTPLTNATIVDPDVSESYQAVSDRWQAVDAGAGGTVHEPKGKLYPTSDLIQRSTSQPETETFVWQQQPYIDLSMSVPDLDYGKVDAVAGEVKRNVSDWKIILDNNSYPQNSIKVKLTVAMEQPLTSGSNTLSNALFFRDYKGNETYLSDQPLTIFDNYLSFGETQLNWDDDRGFLMNINNKFVPMGKYQTKLDWTLSDSI